jgi:hypothetical protein
MNICILSYGRTGGTTLGNWLSKELNKKYIHEPYNPNHFKLYENMNFYDKNFIIKLEPEHIQNVDGNKITIGLIRENEKNCAISHLNMNETKNYNKPYYVSDEWISLNQNKINQLIEKIQYQNNHIKKMNYDILLTYEGLYENKNDIIKICKFLNIQNTKYLGMMDSKNKYRKNEIFKKDLI